MKLFVNLAYRNLLRQKRRTLLTFSAMSLGTFLLILTLSINEGFLWSMIINSTEYYHSHFKISSQEYYAQTDIHHTISSSVPPVPFHQNGIAQGSPRLESMMLLSRGTSNQGKQKTHPAQIIGINPDLEKKVTLLHSNMVHGSFDLKVKAGTKTPILLGKQLSEALEVKVGDELIGMGQGARGSIASALFTVKGIFSSSDLARDATLSLVNIKALQEIMDLKDQAHTWHYRTTRPLKGVLETSARLNQEHPELKTLSWREIMPQISQVLDIWDVTQWITILIFYFAVVLITSNTMSMSIMERTRELAILQVIGLGKFKTGLLVILEGLILSVASAILGGITGFLTVSWLNTNPINLSKFFLPVSWGGMTLEAMIRAYPTYMNQVAPIGLMLVLGPITCVLPLMRFYSKKPARILGEH